MAHDIDEGTRGEHPRLMTTEQARVYLGLDSARTVRTFITQGKLRALRAGRNIMIARVALDEFLEHGDDR